MALSCGDDAITPPDDDSGDNDPEYGWFVQSTEDLFAVWGAAEDDMYAFGRGSTILRFDGPVSVATSKNLRAVCGTSDVNMGIVGEDGVIVTYGPLDR